MNYITGLLMTMADTTWDLTDMLNNLYSSMNTWGQLLVAIIGAVMIVVGVVKIAQGMMSGGRGQVNWVLCLGLILIGGFLVAGSGWGLIQQLGGGAKDTLNDLGTTHTGNTPSWVTQAP